MSDQDTASNRRNRLKDLRANLAAKEGGIEHEVDPAPTRRPGWRGSGPAGGAGRLGGAGGGDFRTRILNSLKDVGEDDQLIEGTEVGQDNLEKLMDMLDRAESTGRGKKMVEIVRGLLDPVETDSGLEFSPEGVAKLVSFLEQGPGPGQDRRPGAAGRRANRPQGRGLRGGWRTDGKPP